LPNAPPPAGADDDEEEEDDDDEDEEEEGMGMAGFPVPNSHASPAISGAPLGGAAAAAFCGECMPTSLMTRFVSLR